MNWTDHPVPSACWHAQPVPTDTEIAGCPEVIDRECPVCAAPLWWNVDLWRKV